MGSEANLSLVHLIRKGNPRAYHENFLASLQQFEMGTSCELVLLFKGFGENDQLPNEICSQIGYLPVTSLLMEDRGYDINAYRFATGAVNSRFLLFMNSHSRIQADFWLEKLLKGFERRPDAGIVGATGNWESLTEETPFPNVHVRTNAFLIPRELFLSLEFGALITKRDCNAFEAGPVGMTKQILSRGLKPYTVGKDGRVFSWEQWPESKIFRSGEQENLLVSDNRTRDYQAASRRKRRKLEKLSWGRPFLEGSLVRSLTERILSKISR